MPIFAPYEYLIRVEIIVSSLHPETIWYPPGLYTESGTSNVYCETANVLSDHSSTS